MSEYIVDARPSDLFGIKMTGLLVRCKDCKHRPTQTQPGKAGFTLKFPDGSLCPAQCSDGYYSWYPPDNFFCGYGERKDGENIEKEE